MQPDDTQRQARQASPENSSYSMLDYLAIIIARKRFIGTVTLATTLIALAFSLLLPIKYTSTARILPPQQESGFLSLMMGTLGGGMGSFASDLFGKISPADQCATILESDRISDSIIDRFKLMNIYEVKYRYDMYKVLDGLVDVSVGAKDGIVSIAVTDRDPKRAADIANAYIEELIKLTAEMSSFNSTNTRMFLEKRLKQARTDLAAAEDSMKHFQTKNKAIDVPEQAKATIGGIAQLQAQFAFHEMSLAALRRRFTDNSQEVKDEKVAIEKIRAEIAKLEGTEKGGAFPTVGSVPELGQEYVRLLREFKIRETVVEVLTKQYETAIYTEAKNIVNINVIQNARVPDKKSKPKRKYIVMIGMLAGFFGSIFVTFIIEYLHQISSENQQRMRDLVRQLMAWRSSGA